MQGCIEEFERMNVMNLLNFNFGRSKLVAITLSCMGVLLSDVSHAVTVEAASPLFKLSLQEDGIRQSTGVETLTFGSTWDGDENSTVTIAQDGVTIAENLTGEGDMEWRVTKNGTYTLTHTTYTNGIAGKVETATFVVRNPFASAKQRYPWNGLVDIDINIPVDENKKAIVSLKARDVDGGTNIPIRTAWIVGGSVTNNTFIVEAGNHKFLWDSNADIANDIDYKNIVIDVDVNTSIAPYAKYVTTFTVDGYTGSETLVNVPVLVRVSSEIDGFNYSDLGDASDGGDIIFTDEDESVIYHSEVDEWNPKGESLFWVRIPTVKKGTKFKMLYGSTLLAFENGRSRSVWNEYAGVWHMNEKSGIAYDSTANRLNAVPTVGGRSTANKNNMVSYSNGACGKARVNDIATGQGGSFLLTPNYSAYASSTSFTVSGWFRATDCTSYPRLFSRKNSSSDANGWEVHIRPADSTDSVVARGASDASSGNEFTIPTILNNWVYLTFVYNDSEFTCFTNGCLRVSAPGVTATDNGLGLAFGGNPAGSEYTWCGQYDEIRLRSGTPSADRVKADYDMISNKKFLTTSSVSESVFKPYISQLFLDAPKNVKENSRWGDCFDLVWDPVPGATKYEIYVTPNSYGSLETAKYATSVTECAFLDDSKEFGGTLCNAWIRAVDDNGNVSEFVGPFNYGNWVTQFNRLPFSFTHNIAMMSR